MASGAAAAGGGGGAVATGGGNPFYQVTNLFSQPNKQGAVGAYQLTTSQNVGGGNVNPGNFLRAVRLLVRTSTNGSAITTTGDYPFNIFANLGLLNVDGSEIIYNVLSGYELYLARVLFRPWLTRPDQMYDFAASATAPSFTAVIQPEVRQALGALENTDTRSAFNYTQSIATSTAVGGTTMPTITVTPFVDMWAQPDGEDLERVPNQQIPNGVNLQTKLRHQVFTLNAAGSDNNLLSTLTGNAVRGMALVLRDNTASAARQNYASGPIQWQLDQRNLSSISGAAPSPSNTVTQPDILYQWAQDFYAGCFGQAIYAAGTNPPTGYQQGVLPFPRFYDPGNLYGQGWLYTANSTALSWEFLTAAGASNLPGTITLLQEEVYATGPVDPSLIDL